VNCSLNLFVGLFPFSLALWGQYIVKNIVLIAAAIAIGSHVRDKD